MPDESRLDYRDPEWVAQQLGLDKNTVYRYLDDGTIPALRLGRKWLVSESSLVDSLKRKERAQTELRRSISVTRDGAISYDKFMERIEALPVVEEAKRAIALAREEALARGHGYLGQEHFLLVFARERDSVAGKMLSNLGVDIQLDIEAVIGRGDGPATGELGLTPRAVKAFEFAVKESRDLGHDYVGTEHILIGIVRAEEGIGFELLESRGVDLERLRMEINRVRSEAQRETKENAAQEEQRPEG